MEDSEGFTQLAMPNQQQGAAPTHGLYVQFYNHPKLNQVESDKANRPIYEDLEYIRIMVPGDKSSVVERPMRVGANPKMDNHRFAQEYAAFKQGNADKLFGTPLDEWNGISRSQAKELEYFNVKTVEQLADMADSAAQKFAGIMPIRAKAKAYIDDANDGAPLAAVHLELAAQKEKSDAQEQQIQALIEELGETKGKKRREVAS